MRALVPLSGSHNSPDGSLEAPGSDHTEGGRLAMTGSQPALPYYPYVVPLSARFIIELAYLSPSYCPKAQPSRNR